MVALQLLLSILSEQNGWKLWVFPWWSWLILIGPELALVAFLIHGRPDVHELTLTLVLIGLMCLVNALALTALIGSVVTAQEKSGGQLLLKGITVWATNVTAFGLAFWELDARGPIEHDFQFPQMENPELAEPGWRARLVDYFYVSFTNSVAFSPTDAMPLSRRAKLLMLVESAVSAIAILLVAARAVNIFK